MAELTVEQLQEIVSKYDQIVQLQQAGNLDGVKSAIDSLSPTVDRLKTSLTGAADSAASFKDMISSMKIEDAKDKLNDLYVSLNDVAQGAGLTESQILRLGAGLASTILVASGKLNISNEMRILSDTAKDATLQLSDMSSTVGALVPKTGALGKMFNALGGAIGPVMRQADMARNLETALLRASAAGGDMGRVMTEMGGAMDDPSTAFMGLADQSARFIALTTDIATANNISAGMAAQYAEQLLRIPGAMRESVEVGNQNVESLHMLDAVLKVSSGTFQDFKTVMDDVNTLFETFRSSGQDSLSVISRMHNAAQAFQIPMNNMRSAVKTAAEQFKFLGDNSQSAIEIMSKFSGALRESGVGPAAIQQMVSGFTGLISKMDIAQRAFVSAQTGGPGGLQGAFQMTLAMREGRGTDVAAQVEQTLRQMMGGQLVTLQEAATDARAAAQMTRQVQMLTTGPLAVAQDEAQAIRLVEAMAQGRLFEAGEEITGVAGPEDALQQAVTTGNEIQEQQASTLLMIHNELQRQSNLAGIAIESSRRIMEGRGTMPGAMLAERRMAATTRSAEEPFMPTLGGLDMEIDRTKQMFVDVGEAAIDTVSRIGQAGARGFMPEFMEEPEVALPQQQQMMTEPGRALRRIGMAEPLPVVPIPQELQRWERVQGGAQAAGTPQLAGPTNVGAENTVIIKVMGQRDVENLIKIQFDKLGQMHVEQAHGIPGE